MHASVVVRHVFRSDLDAFTRKDGRLFPDLRRLDADLPGRSSSVRLPPSRTLPSASATKISCLRHHRVCRH